MSVWTDDQTGSIPIRDFVVKVRTKGWKEISSQRQKMEEKRYENGLIHVAFSGRRMKVLSNVWILFWWTQTSIPMAVCFEAERKLLCQTTYPPLNRVRTTEMQMLMAMVRGDLPQTYTLSLNNLCSPDETEHLCQIWSGFFCEAGWQRDLVRRITNQNIVIKMKSFRLPCSRKPKRDVLANLRSPRV